VNANSKRPLVTPAGKGSPTQPVPLKRDSRLGTYFEYDLSKMVNTKGGFLFKENGEADEEVRRKEREKEREKQRTQHNLEIRERRKQILPTCCPLTPHIISHVSGPFP
jgi:DNA-repair protein complementing XP-A cells